jgi:hypothetical protein
MGLFLCLSEEEYKIGKLEKYSMLHKHLNLLLSECKIYIFKIGNVKKQNKVWFIFSHGMFFQLQLKGYNEFAAITNKIIRNLCSKWWLYYIKLHGYNNSMVITNKYWWSCKVRYNQVWLYVSKTQQMSMQVCRIELLSYIRAVFLYRWAAVLLWAAGIFDGPTVHILYEIPINAQIIAKICIKFLKNGLKRIKLTLV